MCMAMSFSTRDHYFGRNLDLDEVYDTRITVSPRNLPFRFRCGETSDRHPAMVGMATVVNGYPLYFEATSERGLSAASLQFSDCCVYARKGTGRGTEVASFELIPWLLCRCGTVEEVRNLMTRTTVTDETFGEGYPAAPLHWMVSDRTESVVIESTADGLQVHDNHIGIMTNSPPFPHHVVNMVNHMGVSSKPPVNRFTGAVDLRPYCRGMGSIGLPGDMSSMSRFVRGAFALHNSVCDESETGSVGQFFHIMGTTSQPRGCNDLGCRRYELTQYTSCCNTDTGVYYYTTYGNRQISAVDMHRTDLEGRAPICYRPVTDQQVLMQNRAG